MRRDVRSALTPAVLTAAAGTASIAVASAVFQTVRERQDRRRFPPPGRLVEANGHRLHLLCEGSGSPTVIVVPALGTSSIEWIGIQRELVPDIRVCLYDRGGLGWSDHVPGRRDFGALVDELHALLTAAEMPGPYVLVGHSIGGLIARLLTYRHPDDVAGLVLVDSSHEEQFGPLHEWGEMERRALRYRLKWLGIIRALAERNIVNHHRVDVEHECPPDLVECGLALSLTSRKRKAVAGELLGWRHGSCQVRDEKVPLTDLPVTVITRSVDLTASPRGHFTGPDGARREAIWQELQRDLAALSSQTRHVHSETAGHHIQLDDPALVVEEIRRMHALIRDELRI